LRWFCQAVSLTFPHLLGKGHVILPEARAYHLSMAETTLTVKEDGQPHCCWKAIENSSMKHGISTAAVSTTAAAAVAPWTPTQS